MHRYGICLATVLAGAVLLTACGGSGAVQTGQDSSGSGATNKSAPAVVTAGDAPMNSVLAALVTVSAVTFTSASGSVSLLTQPTTIELTHLGGIRAPLVMNSLAAGTYTSMSIGVSAATITYVNSAGSVVTSQATIPSGQGTQTITFTSPLTVSSSSAVDVRFDFDLQKSLDLTGSTVTFTPVIGGAAANVQGEAQSDRTIYLDGTVSATSTSANTITVVQESSGLSVTLNVNQQTSFDDSLTLATLTTGTEVETVDTLGTDGTLTADSVDDVDGGTSEGQQGRVDGGVVVSVTRDSQNNLTSFTMVIRNCLHADNLGKTLTVDVNSGTDIKSSMRATNAGLSSFDQSSIFAGQGVWVAGTTVQTATDTVLATEIRPAAVSPVGLTTAAVQAGASGAYSVVLLLNNESNFAQFANITSVTVDINSQTVLDGQGLSSASLANLAGGTPLIARGFLSASGSSDVLFCSHLHEQASSN
ncbi:MAG: DUF4382 domain-containing protein [Terriglobales bacterium]